MTAQERARALHTEWQNRTSWKEEMILDIERAIEAAEEEKAKVVRQACAEIACMVKEELSQQPEKLQYGRTQIEVAEYIEAEIRTLPL